MNLATGKQSTPRKRGLSISHHPDLTVLGLQKCVLEQAGIASFVLNGNSWWLANGGVSLLLMFLGKTAHVQNPLFAPVLCLAEDEDFEEAVTIMQACQDHMNLGDDWGFPETRRAAQRPTAAPPGAAAASY